MSRLTILKKTNLAKVIKQTMSLNSTRSLAVSSKFIEEAAKVGNYFRNIIKINPCNIYASLGLGIILALQGELNAARDIFAKIRDINPTIVDAWINLGHIHLQDLHWEQAIICYKYVLDKLWNTTMMPVTGGGNNNLTQYISILHCLALAYYYSNDLINCKLMLLKAIHLNPNHYILWYNLALAQEHFAIDILNKSRYERNLDQVKHAIYDLQSALSILRNLYINKLNNNDDQDDDQAITSHLMRGVKIKQLFKMMRRIKKKKKKLY